MTCMRCLKSHLQVQRAAAQQLLIDRRVQRRAWVRERGGGLGQEQRGQGGQALEGNAGGRARRAHQQAQLRLLPAQAVALSQWLLTGKHWLLSGK